MSWLPKAISVAAVTAVLGGCGTTIPVALPPSLCKPATDLPSHKYLERLPEVSTGNDVLYQQFLKERSTHAKDIQQYNSLYGTCVDPTQLPNALKIFAD